MNSSESRNELNDNRFAWFHLFGRLGVTAAGYPFEYVKILIQIGHEPLQPFRTTTLFGRPAMRLPGAFSYLKHIKQTDGFFGLYRGMVPKLCTNFLSMFTYTVVYEKVPNLCPEELLGKPEGELTNEQKLIVNAHELLRCTVTRCVSIIVSHPLHIICIRTIAQFVGREEKYGEVFGSLVEIYRQDGILGFFSGLVPRMLGEILTMWVATSTTVLLNTYLVEEEPLKGYVRASMNYLSSSFFYPFQLVSHVVIVNNCGLRAGYPPNMPIYTGWSDAWNHLSALGELKRGASIFWRYYKGIQFSGRGSSRRVYAQPKYVTCEARSIYNQAFPYSLLL